MTWDPVRSCVSAKTLAIIEAELGFAGPTPVQAAAIRLFAQHKDIIARAVTGSGKTLAFVVPMLELLHRAQPDLDPHALGGLILLPTRELATQVHQVLRVFLASPDEAAPAKYTYTSFLATGGSKTADDLLAIGARGANIVVGTPGRIEELFRRNKDPARNTVVVPDAHGSPLHTVKGLSFRRFEMLIIDEADRLMQLGFQDSVSYILSRLPRQRRTGLFSATMPDSLQQLARAGLRNPVRINVSVTASAAASTDAQPPPHGAHADLECAREKRLGVGYEKLCAPIASPLIPANLRNYYMLVPYQYRVYELLQHVLAHPGEKIIVFFATCDMVAYYHDALAAYVADHKPAGTRSIRLHALHGKLSPARREQVFAAFQESRLAGDAQADTRILLSTDVSARGLDIPSVDTVVQFTLPSDAEGFVHRIGRTCRGTGPRATGRAVAFVDYHEEGFLPLLANHRVPIQRAASHFDDIARNLNLYAKIEHPGTEGAAGAAGAFGTFGSYQHFLYTAYCRAKADKGVQQRCAQGLLSYVQYYLNHKLPYIFPFRKLNLLHLVAGFALGYRVKSPQFRALAYRASDHASNKYAAESLACLSEYLSESLSEGPPPVAAVPDAVPAAVPDGPQDAQDAEIAFDVATVDQDAFTSAYLYLHMQAFKPYEARALADPAKMTARELALAKQKARRDEARKRASKVLLTLADGKVIREGDKWSHTRVSKIRAAAKRQTKRARQKEREIARQHEHERRLQDLQDQQELKDDYRAMEPLLKKARRA